MDSTREKLIELLDDALLSVDWDSNDYPDTDKAVDILIANGVTVQKWIPVTERLPERNDDGTVNAVLVTNGAVQHIAYFAKDIFYFTENGEMKEPMFYKVTHWMPLPEAPKED